MTYKEDKAHHPGRKVGRSDLENTLRNILAAPFENHAIFKGAADAMRSGSLNHPENEPPLNMADGLPEEDQYGAVHVNKNL